MRVLFWNVVFATWLLISAFLFTRTPASMALVAIAALAIVVMAVLAMGRPGARYVTTFIALALAAFALLLPGVSALARLNDALFAALLFALSLVSPVHHARPGPAASVAR